MKKLLRKDPIVNAYEIFSERTPSCAILQSYCSEVQKRVQYHLKNNMPLTVKYFIDELRTLSEDTKEGIC